MTKRDLDYSPGLGAVPVPLGMQGEGDGGSPKCALCGCTRFWHCDMDEPGLDHPSTCDKLHHEFRSKPDPGAAA